jgi:peroxiredoxin
MSLELDATWFDDRRRAGWNQVDEFWRQLQRGETDRAADPQPQLAAEFFELFLEHRDTVIGRKALSTAFTMWGNTRSADAAQQALDSLDLEADYWGPVLHGVINACARSGRRDEILGILHRYESRLTHPRSKSSLLLNLGGRYLYADQPDKARAFYEEVRRLAVDPTSLREAEGALYEIGSLQVGMPAPQFEARTISGDTLRLSDLNGSVVCLDFWETECGPCWAEFPTLRMLYAEFPRPSFHLIGISSDRDAGALRDVINRERLAWPQVREEVQWQDRTVVLGPLRKLYNIWGVPTAIVIDQSGRIAAKRLRGDDLMQGVRRIVGGP